MELKSHYWSIGTLVAMAGVCAVVVGMALGTAHDGTVIASVIFNGGIFTLVLTLGIAAMSLRVDLRQPSLLAGLVGASTGMYMGFWTVYLPILSLVALAGAAMATRHQRASIVLMLVPAVMGWMASPAHYSIPARILIGASLLLAVVLVRSRFAGDRYGLETGRGYELPRDIGLRARRLRSSQSMRKL